MVSRVAFLGSVREPRFLLQDVLDPLPEPAEGQILARVRLTTVCDSDLRALTEEADSRMGAGAYPVTLAPVPRVLGHEAVAEVIWSRRQTPALEAGDRITFSVIDSCGRCEHCDRQLPQNCSQRTLYGSVSMTERSGLNGSFSTHVLITPGTTVVALPSSLPDRLAAPANCALATVVNAASSIGADAATAVIQGSGLLAVYACAFLKEKGLRVFCTTQSRGKLLLISQFGGIPLHPDLPQVGDHRPPEGSVDVFIDTSESQEMLDSGLRCLRPGGLCLLVGCQGTGNASWLLNASHVFNKSITVKGVSGYAPGHLQEAVEFLDKVRNKYPFDGLLSPAYPMGELTEALGASHNYMRVALRP